MNKIIYTLFVGFILAILAHHSILLASNPASGKITPTEDDDYILGVITDAIEPTLDIPTPQQNTDLDQRMTIESIDDKAKPQTKRSISKDLEEIDWDKACEIANPLEEVAEEIISAPPPTNNTDNKSSKRSLSEQLSLIDWNKVYNNNPDKSSASSSDSTTDEEPPVKVGKLIDL